jgi:hypothetical protein
MGNVKGDLILDERRNFHIWDFQAVFIELQVFRGRDRLFTRFWELSYFVPCPFIANGLLIFWKYFLILTFANIYVLCWVCIPAGRTVL